MPRFTLSHRAYTRLFSSSRSPSLAVEHDFKPNKMAFWNRRVPQMFQRQLHELLRYPPAGTVISRTTANTGHSPGTVGNGLGNRSVGWTGQQVSGVDWTTGQLGGLGNRSVG